MEVEEQRKADIESAKDKQEKHMREVQEEKVKRYSTLQYTAIHCSAPQRTATYCNTLQHIATRCNIL